MPKVWIRSELGIDGKFQKHHSGKATWTVPGTFPVTVHLDFDARTFADNAETEISPALAKVFEDKPKPSKELPAPLRQELSQIREVLNRARQLVLEQIRFGLHWASISETMVISAEAHGTEWSLDGTTWVKPPLQVSAHAWVGIGEWPLDAAKAEIVQARLTKGFRPLMGWRHLHRAYSERDSRFAWIDATIASELAIKQFLILLKPDVKALILEVPSPPLGKLYGSVLKALLGVEAPHKGKLAAGAETRNKLIHRPEDHPIGIEELHEYLAVVHETLEFLEGEMRKLAIGA